MVVTRLIIAAVMLLVVAAAPAHAERLFTSGFELRSVTNGVEWYTTDAAIAAPAINTTANRVRSGTASLRIQNGTSATAKGLINRTIGSFVNGTEYFTRCYVWFDGFPNAATTILGFGSAGSSDRVRVSVSATGVLSILADTGGSQQTVAGSTTLSTGQWYRIEFRGKRHATTPDSGADEAELRIDGVTEASSTALSFGTWTRLLVGTNLSAAETMTTGDWYIEDCAINDSTGTSQNSWPGEGNVEMLVPNGAGEFSQTVTLGGSSPAATDWEALDDGVATGTVDGDDYVTFTTQTTNWTTTGSRIAVALSDLVESAASITLVTFGARVRNSSTLSSAYQMTAQTANSGTRPADSAVPSWSDATAWLLNSSAVSRAANAYTLHTAPDGTAWTESALDNLQMLIRATDADPDIDITAAWAMVDYVEGTPPPPVASGLGTRTTLTGAGR